MCGFALVLCEHNDALKRLKNSTKAQRMRFQREVITPTATLKNLEPITKQKRRESWIPARFFSFTPTPTNRARSRTLKHIRTSQTDKNFPIGPRRHAKQTKSSLPIWRGPVGKFSEGQGGLEGRDPSFKRGPCASKVFPSPSKVFLSRKNCRTPLQKWGVNVIIKYWKR